MLNDPDTGIAHTDPTEKLKIAAKVTKKLYEKHSNEPKGSPFISKRHPLVPGINDQITYAEVENMCKALDNNKACGIDGICPEFIKYGGKPLFKALVMCFNFALQKHVTPEAMTISKFSMLYKNKGCPKDLSNYRNLALQSVVGKVFTSILAKRITSGNLTSSLQYGFKPANSTTDAVFTMCQVVGARLAKKKYTNACYIDFKKAFDSCARKLLYKACSHYGIRGNVLEWLKSYYKGSKACVGFKGKNSKTFSVERGVAQGDPLSPNIFIIFINNLIEKIVASGIGVNVQLKNQNNMFVPCLAYADDIVLLCENPEDLQKLIDICAEWCNAWGMLPNVLKCATMEFGRRSVNQMCKHTWGNKEIPRTTNYEYLGVTMQSSFSFVQHVKKLTSNARKKFFVISKFLKNKHIDKIWITRVFKTCILPVLMFSVDAIPLSKSDKKTLRNEFQKLARILTGLHKKASIKAILQELGLSNLETTLQEKIITLEHKFISRRGNPNALNFYRNQNDDPRAFSKRVRLAFGALQITNNEIFGLASLPPTI